MPPPLHNDLNQLTEKHYWQRTPPFWSIRSSDWKAFVSQIRLSNWTYTMSFPVLIIRFLSIFTVVAFLNWVFSFFARSIGAFGYRADQTNILSAICMCVQRHFTDAVLSRPTPLPVGPLCCMRTCLMLVQVSFVHTQWEAPCIYRNGKEIGFSDKRIEEAPVTSGADGWRWSSTYVPDPQLVKNQELSFWYHVEASPLRYSQTSDFIHLL